MMNNPYLMQNPYLNPQTQLNNLISQHPQYFNQGVQQAVQQSQVNTVSEQQINGYPVIPVANFEEANAHIADYSGIPKFFYNRAQNEIYKKQLDKNTEKVIIEKFKLTDETKTTEKTIGAVKNNDYKEEFQALNNRIDELKNKFDNLYSVATTFAVSTQSKAPIKAKEAK